MALCIVCVSAINLCLIFEDSTGDCRRFMSQLSVLQTRACDLLEPFFGRYNEACNTCHKVVVKQTSMFIVCPPSLLQRQPSKKKTQRRRLMTVRQEGWGRLDFRTCCCIRGISSHGVEPGSKLCRLPGLSPSWLRSQ